MSGTFHGSTPSKEVEWEIDFMRRAHYDSSDSKGGVTGCRDSKYAAKASKQYNACAVVAIEPDICLEAEVLAATTSEGDILSLWLVSGSKCSEKVTMAQAISDDGSCTGSVNGFATEKGVHRPCPLRRCAVIDRRR